MSFRKSEYERPESMTVPNSVPENDDGIYARIFERATAMLSEIGNPSWVFAVSHH